MSKINLWEQVRRTIKAGVKNNFTEIRKLIGYKSEETLANMLGITRQTLSKFGIPENPLNDKTSNTLLLSIIALMDQFIYANRYDTGNIKDYIQKLDEYFFSAIYADEDLVKKVKLMDCYFFSNYSDKIESRYIEIWLKTFENQENEKERKNTDVISYNQLTIRQIINKYHLYITSEFLLHDRAEEFFNQVLEILIKKNRKIKISDFTIDDIQNTRIAIEYEKYKNGIKALNIINALGTNNFLFRIESNPKCKNEIDLIINEILEKNMNNVIVLSQGSSYKILDTINTNSSSGENLMLRMITKEFKVLSLTLNDDDIDINEGRGYKICALPNEL